MDHGIFFPIRPFRTEDVVGVFGKSRRIHLSEIAVFRLIRGRLTDIVNGCPDELTTGIRGISVHSDTVFRIFRRPAGSTVAQRRTLFVRFDQIRPLQRKMIHPSALYHRGSLTSVDDPVRMLFMVFRIIFFRVVIARHFHDIRTFLGIFPGHIIGANGNRCNIAIVPLSDRRDQPAGDLLTMSIRMGIRDLIANTPHDNRGMIAVSANPAAYILLHPFLEKSGIIIRILCHLPHIERFGYDQKSHLIRQFHQFHSGHIMGSPHSIDTHGSHEVEFTAHGFFVKSCSQRSEVMVVTGTVQAHFSAV